MPATTRARRAGIAEGLELIRAALSPADRGRTAPRLTVHPRCARFIEAFRSYHYPPSGPAARADRPVKDGPDHLIDALRYFFINRLGQGADSARLPRAVEMPSIKACPA